MTQSAASFGPASGAKVLEAIVGRLKEMPPAERAKLAADALKATRGFVWAPNPGPQTDAYFTLADELFFGGSAGGGKSSLLVGLALTAHRNSLLFRREYTQVKGLEDEAAGVLGTREGYNSQTKTWRLPDGRVLEFGSVQHEDDKENYQGRPHDLIGFDELPHFTESQYTFLIGWNRPTSRNSNQRCRVVATGNPPVTSEGYWVVKRWRAWLDSTHPNPAKPGELRWYTTVDGKDVEVDGPGPHMINGREVRARSRTFLPARLEDNIDLMQSNYAATLEAMPEPYRTMLREGRFDLVADDHMRQVIPTEWVRQAQRRWKPHPPEGSRMCCLGVDIASGGKDETIIARRHDSWFAPIEAVPGAKTPLGSDVAALVVKHRRDNAVVVLDMGGGYGGGAYECLLANGIEAVPHKGVERSTKRTADRAFAFTNKRSELIWKFREALDPDQQGGSQVALPEDPALVADLTAPRFEIGPRGIEIESKEDVVRRLGRSPDRGDAVAMAWSEGPHTQAFASAMHGLARTLSRFPQTILGHAAAKANRGARHARA